MHRYLAPYFSHRSRFLGRIWVWNRLKLRRQAMTQRLAQIRVGHNVCRSIAGCKISLFLSRIRHLQSNHLHCCSVMLCNTIRKELMALPHIVSSCMANIGIFDIPLAEATPPPKNVESPGCLDTLVWGSAPNTGSNSRFLDRSRVSVNSATKLFFHVQNRVLFIYQISDSGVLTQCFPSYIFCTRIGLL